MTGPGWLRMFVESAGRPERRFQAEHAQSEAGGVFSAPVSGQDYARVPRPAAIVGIATHA